MCNLTKEKFKIPLSTSVSCQQIASAMVACTFISAPLMFVSARMVTLTKLNPADYLPELDAFVFHVSIAGAVFCVSSLPWNIVNYRE